MCVYPTTELQNTGIKADRWEGRPDGLSLKTEGSLFPWEDPWKEGSEAREYMTWTASTEVLSLCLQLATSYGRKHQGGSRDSMVETHRHKPVFFQSGDDKSV